MVSGTVSRTVTDDTLPGGPVEREIVYYAPLTGATEADYERAWREFEPRGVSKMIPHHYFPTSQAGNYRLSPDHLPSQDPARPHGYQNSSSGNRLFKGPYLSLKLLPSGTIRENFFPMFLPDLSPIRISRNPFAPPEALSPFHVSSHRNRKRKNRMLSLIPSLTTAIGASG